MGENKIQQNENGVREGLKIILNEKATILAITLIFVLMTAFISSTQPKTYSSTALIQLGKINNNYAYNAIESKNIIESSAILEQVSQKYPDEKKNTVLGIQARLTTDLLSAEITYSKSLVSPHVSVKLQGSKPETTQNMLEEILESFIQYGNIRLEEMEKPFTLIYNESVRAAEENHDNILMQIDRQIMEKQENHELLEAQAKELKQLITGLKEESLTTEGMAKTTLLRSLHNDLTQRIIITLETITMLENQKIQEGTLLRERVNNATINYEKIIATKEDFKILDKPQRPEKSLPTNTLLKLIISAFIGLGTSCAIVLIKNHGKLQNK